MPPQDFDCDGFDGAKEVFVDTDASDRCADTTTPNDERGPAFAEPLSPWPTDNNDDRWTNLSDVSLMSAAYNKSLGQPGYEQRKDFNASNSVNLSDVSLMSPFYNKTCTP